MISIKTQEEIKVMREGGFVLAKTLKRIEKEIGIGVNGGEIEKLTQELILKVNGKCSFKGVNNFPACICFSVNEEIVHGLPSAKKVLKKGDVLSLDLGIFFPLENFVKKIDKKDYPNLINGFHTDAARTYLISEADLEKQRLIRITKKALKRAIKKSRPGNTFGDIGETIERFALKQGFNIVDSLCGHGIGAKLHEAPDVLNHGQRHKGIELKPGMVFCLEPMFSMGSSEIKKGNDGTSYITKDNSLSAHFEDMVAIVKDGSVVLTEI